MKLFLLLAANCISLFASTLSVEINDLHVNDKDVYVGLYRSNNKFMSLQDTYERKIVKASSGHLDVVFENLQNGNYALALFHDENANKQLDKNFLGVPKEGYGISNNPHTLFEPTFKDAVFTLKNDQKVQIRVVYP